MMMLPVLLVKIHLEDGFWMDMEDGGWAPYSLIVLVRPKAQITN